VISVNKIEKMLSYLIEERFPDVLLNYPLKSLLVLDGMIRILKELLGDEYFFRKVRWELDFRKLCEKVGIDLWLVSWRRWVKNGKD
jgi:hypothetical protein